jgi:hypothetical protein
LAHGFDRLPATHEHCGPALGERYGGGPAGCPACPGERRACPRGCRADPGRTSGLVAGTCANAAVAIAKLAEAAVKQIRGLSIVGLLSMG